MRVGAAGPGGCSSGLEASRPPVLLGPHGTAAPSALLLVTFLFFDTAAAIYFGFFYSFFQSSCLQKHTTKGFPAQI